ncbi:hypothetical protein Tco_0105561 [Tanacetum coccineum]
MCTTFASIYPSNNTQLETSSNPMHQVAMPERQTLHCVGNCLTWIQLSKEQLAILANTGERVDFGPGAFTVITNALFRSDGIDLYDSDCDEVPTAQVSFMANLSSYGSYVLSEVPHSETYQNDMANQSVQAMPYFEQIPIVDYTDNEITNSMILSVVEQMTYHVANLDKENQTNKMVNESLTAELERYKERVAIFEQRLNVDLNKREKLIDSQIDDLIRKRNAKFAAFHVIAKEHVVIFVIDDEETLILEEESLSKMLDKQNDPISIEKKIKISPIDYSKLNKIKEDFGKHFFTQKDLSAEQAFWLKHSSISETPVTSHTLVRIEAPSELPKCSVDKNIFEIEKKELKLENERLLEHIIYQEVVNIVMHADGKFDNVLPVANTFLDDNIALDVMKMENDHLMELLVSQDLVHTVVIL